MVKALNLCSAPLTCTFAQVRCACGVLKPWSQWAGQSVQVYIATLTEDAVPIKGFHSQVILYSREECWISS
jgi:hypothetical protein